MARVFVFMLVVFGLVAGALGQSKAEALPTPDEIVGAYHDAIGGRDVIEVIKTRRCEGEFSMPGTGTRGPIRILWVAPATQRIELELGGDQPSRSWTTAGGRSWSYTGEALESFDDRELEDRKRRAVLFPLLHWRERFVDARTIAIETVNGARCYAVEFDTPDCRTTMSWFDAETGLLARVADEVVVGGQRYDAITDILSYRDIGDVKVADRMRRTINYGQQTSVQVYEFSLVEHDARYDERVFDPPAELPDLAEDTRPAGLPDAQTLIDRHLEANGGRDAHTRIRSRRLEGTFSQNASNGQRIVAVNEAPNRQHVLLGGARYVVNGEFAWTMGPSGLEVAGGPQERQSLRRAAMFPLLEWRRWYRSAETVDVRDEDGRRVYVVAFETPHCERVEYFFDAETGRAVRWDEPIAYGSQTFRSQTRVERYEAHDGVSIPVVTRRTLQGAGANLVQVVRIDSVQHNVEIPEGLFDAPAELRRSAIPSG